MVLLTYRSGTASLGSSSVSEEETSENECINKDDGPKTAYIDKLGCFKEEDAIEEKCDLFFICKDGEIPAHRLVVGNASKFILAMQDDQPPWFPVYISVPDLTKEIVQTLVQLAYTGKMDLPPSTTPDELLDAMQALGWVNTDCLTATYMDSNNPVSDEDFGTAVSTKTAESLETVLKMSFPVSTKDEAEAEAEASDDEKGMELDLPDVPSSDEEDSKSTPLEEKKTSKTKAEPEQSRRPTRSNQAKTAKVDPTPKVDPKTPKKKQKNSPETNRKPAAKETSPISRSRKAQLSPPKSEAKRSKGAKKSSDNDNNTVVTPNEKPDAKDITQSAPILETETVRSRTRTIRKPKKFDDAIVLTPTKRKESSIKSPAKPTGKVPKNSETETDAFNNSTSTNSNNTIKPPARGRRNTSDDSREAIRNSLITSYFNKRSPRKSEDSPTPTTNNTAESETSEDTNSSTLNDLPPINEDEKNSKVEPKDENKSEPEKSDPESATETGKNGSSSSLRGRSRSNTSGKSEKGESQEELSKTSVSRRRKNPPDPTEGELDSDALPPAKRGRKASTISNASKSSNKGANV